jgi:hypothetical protein
MHYNFWPYVLISFFACFGCFCFCSLVLSLSQDGSTQTFGVEARQAGQVVNTYVEGMAKTIDQEHWTKNYIFIPGITVSADFNFVNGIVGFVPSPDWFTGFYLFDTIDEYDRTYFNRFLLHTYPWDAGTDGGETYTSTDIDLDPPVIVSRIYPQNAPGANGNIFVSPQDGSVKPTGEFECRLHVCPLENPECEKENWPPEYGCDVFRFPGCDIPCKAEDVLNATAQCMECVRNENDAVIHYYPNCCRSNMIPKDGNCDEYYDPDAQGDSGAISVVKFSIVATALLVLLTSFLL